ncbi:MAG: prepilin-type N-terminal cleavage/methylation domain-containing protein [Victivallales bacterium]|nr:prepilin-type N-terminal cleavage/methylation domain-containing protein [Victivallales bacterium]
MKSIVSSKLRKFAVKSFSLIELLIVIAIMGALAALILPHFATSESQAKDTVCDYNQAGTVRFLNMFRTMNGVYPSGFHTGLWDGGATLENVDGEDLSTPPTCYNMANKSTIEALTENESKSLAAAGITKLAEGAKTASAIYSEDGEGTVTTFKVAKIKGDWYETYDTTGASPVAKEDSVLEFNGRDFAQILADNSDKYDEMIPLFVAPTIDWENAYLDSGDTEVESKIQVPLVGKCPWPADGKLRYYITFFLVDSTGKNPAKLAGTACPECGVLSQTAF